MLQRPIQFGHSLALKDSGSGRRRERRRGTTPTEAHLRARLRLKAEEGTTSVGGCQPEPEPPGSDAGLRLRWQSSLRCSAKIILFTCLMCVHACVHEQRGFFHGLSCPGMFHEISSSVFEKPFSHLRFFLWAPFFTASLPPKSSPVEQSTQGYSLAS